MKYKVEENTTLSKFLNPKTNRRRHKKRKGKKGKSAPILTPTSSDSVCCPNTHWQVCVCVCVCVFGGGLDTRRTKILSYLLNYILKCVTQCICIAFIIKKCFYPIKHKRET